MVHHRRNAKARRVILRIQDPLTIQVTLPPWASVAEVDRVLRKHTDWLRVHLPRAQARVSRAVQPWHFGTAVLWRGKEEILSEARGLLGSLECRIGSEQFMLRTLDSDFRPQLIPQFKLTAELELVPRVHELAARHNIPIAKVTIRDQRRRWGSCSTRGNISLNWRLLQAPWFVSDYIILHELAHRTHMNHSAAYWGVVESICPEWREAEVWIRANSRRLL